MVRFRKDLRPALGTFAKSCGDSTFTVPRLGFLTARVFLRPWNLRASQSTRSSRRNGYFARPASSTVEGTHVQRSEEHTSELQSHHDLVCRLLLEKKNLIQWSYGVCYSFGLWIASVKGGMSILPAGVACTALAPLVSDSWYHATSIIRVDRLQRKR